jgi:[histone H3]-dimethyl-L-lysine9 demethylase
MNALQDPTKKTSINSLLNPQETSAFPAHPVGSASNQPSTVFHYGPVPSYNLRAASWDSDDDPHNRRHLNGSHNAHRHYQQHPTLPPSSHIYADHHASRLMKSRIDEPSMYPSEGHAWQQHKIPSSPQQQHQHALYVPSVIYSDERTSMLFPQPYSRPILS